MSAPTSQRLEKLRTILSEKGLDAILISCPENRLYLSGFTGSAGYLLISASNTLIATDFRYFEQVKLEAPNFELYPLKGVNPQWLPDAVSSLSAKKMGLEAAHLSQAIYRQFIDAVAKPASDIDIVPQIGIVESLRAIKDAEEISCITKAAALAHKTMEHITAAASPGMTEKELAWESERFLREGGSEQVPFAVIAASGPNSMLPHARPTDRVLRDGEPIVVDLGARVSGYCSDITRTFCIGETDSTFQRIHDVVLGAELTAVATLNHGMTGEQVDRLGRTTIEEAGYGDSFGHGLGHGIGLEAHEAPRLGPSSSDTLLDGMVFTIEPGIYLPGWGGVRIEDTVVLESGKARVLGQESK